MPTSNPQPPPLLPKKEKYSAMGAVYRKIMRFIRMTVRITFFMVLAALVVAIGIGVRKAMLLMKESEEVPVVDKKSLFDDAKAQVDRIETTLAKLEEVLLSTKSERNALASKLKEMGVKSADDLKGNTRAKRTAEDIGRLANEIESQEKKVAAVASKYQQAKAIVRRMEMEQAGLTEQELNNLALQIHESSVSDDGWSQPITPIDINQAVAEALNAKSNSPAATRSGSTKEQKKSIVMERKTTPSSKGIFSDPLPEKPSKEIASSPFDQVLVGFANSCIKASVDGKLEVIEKLADEAKVEIVLQFEIDRAAFKKKATELISILEEWNKGSGDFTAKYRKSGSFGTIKTQFYEGDQRSFQSGIAGMFLGNGSIKDGSLAMVIEENRTQKADSIDYRYFHIDSSLQSSLDAVASRPTQGKLQLLNMDGDSIVTERFTLPPLVCSYGNQHGPTALSRSFNGNDKYEFKTAQVFCLSSVIPSARHAFMHTTLLYQTFSLTLSNDDLDSIQDIRVELGP